MTRPTRLPALLAATLAGVLVSGLALVLVGSGSGAPGEDSGGDTGDLAHGVHLSSAPLAPARAPRVRGGVGFSPGFSIVDASPARLRRDLAGMRRLGARWVRVDVGWARIETSRGRYDWGDTDRVLREARRQGLQVLAVVGYEPGWAVRADALGRRAPVDPRAYASFVDVAAARYAGLVGAWEIWNEPNLASFWGTAPDPAAYARLVEAAAPRIRARDRGATVLAGAMAPANDAADGSQTSPMTFLRGIYNAISSPRVFDAVSVHPYSYPALPGGTEEWNTFHRLNALRGIMLANGDGASRIWLTEYGAPTGRTSRSVTPARQAQMVVGAVREARRTPYLGPLFLYSYRDVRTGSSDPEANFGLVRTSGSPKPAATKLRRELRGPNRPGRR